MNDDGLSSGSSEGVSSDIQVFPNDQSFHCAELKTTKRIIDSETIFTGVQRNLIEVLLNESDD